MKGIRFDSVYWAILEVTILLSLLIEEFAEGVPIACQTGQYFDEIAGRCSLCSEWICHNKRPLPETCKCPCVKDYPSVDYSPDVCRHHSVTGATPGNPGQPSGIILTWLTVLTVVVAVVVVVVAVLCVCVVRHIRNKNMRHCPKGEVEEPLVPPVPDTKSPMTNTNNNNDINSLQTGQYKLDSVHQPVSRPTQECNPSPSKPQDTDLTSQKTLMGSSGEGQTEVRGVPEVGPAGPKEGLPGHDYHLRHP